MWLTTLLKFSVMRYVLLFISKIIFFSVIYLGIFLVTPDAFRFSSDYNIAPLSSYWSTFYDTDDPSSIAMNGVPDDLESFRVQAVALEKAYTAWQARETERRSAEEAYYAIMQELSAEADRNTEEYKNRNIAPLEREVAIIQQKIADVSLSPDEKINLLEISQRLNGEIVRHYDFIIKNRTSSTSDPQHAKAEAAVAELSRASQVATEAHNIFRSERSTLASNFKQARDKIISKVGWADFLYFSACVSTTTTFGDIVANNTLVRIFVACQIFSGIIIVSLMLNAISGANAFRSKN